MILKIFLILTTLLILFLYVSIYIHHNMRGTKIWDFVNKHIIESEDSYLK